MNFTVLNNITTSPVESFICRTLNKSHVTYFREVMFDELVNPKTGKKLRYDFYIPSINLILEYDGKEFHRLDDVIYRDKLKDQYAKSIGIKLIRISGFHNLKLLLNELGFSDFSVSKIDDSKLNIDLYLNYLKTGEVVFIDHYIDLFKSRKLKFINSLKKKIPISMEYPTIKDVLKYRQEIACRLKQK